MSTQPDTPTLPIPASIPLPELTAPDPEIKRLERVTRSLDRSLVVVVLGFAFLVASFAVRNSDFWLHLATGRLIASRIYQPGIDPFAHTTTGLHWINHSWLFDVSLFEARRLLGDVALVIMKALLVMGV